MLQILSRLIAWSPEPFPPIAWNREAPRLLRSGVLTVDGHEVRVYLLNDDTPILNRDDLLRVAYSVRRLRSQSRGGTKV